MFADDYELLWCSNDANAHEVNDYVASFLPEYSRMNSANEGVAKSFNQLALRSKGEYIFLASDDIIYPDNWMATMHKYASSIKNPGVVGIECSVKPGDLSTVDGLEAHFIAMGTPNTFAVFGPTMVSREAFFDIGMLSEEFGNYGMEDSDLNWRMHYSGRLNFYVPGLKSEHIGVGKSDSGEYRRMKDEALKVAHVAANERTGKFGPENFREKIPELRDPI